MSMQNLVAIVTGSSRGIGKGIAKVFGEEGARVVVVARSEEEGGRLPGNIHLTTQEIQEAGGQAMALRCDVTDEEQVQAMAQAVMEAYGRIDVLVNNAGVQVNVGLLELQTRHWDLTMRVNLRGPFLCCKHIAPMMVEQRSGNILNITSSAGENVRPRGISYAVTKAGLNIMTRGLAQELEEHNIAVNALNPGPVKTEGAVLVRPPDFDWTNWDPPEVVGVAAAWLAQQTAQSFTGRIVDRTEFGNTWGT
ncbi:MAG: SDR family oxidoreductase [Chloroflexi bacterium]|nr:SDR family oxidoreductase [Chloroflexota bacterium]MCH8349801.1 SDR family oxidoreductase [Chloroflexota bacterium]MCI0780518.1 SDR family oxidoreductase [Chloroflexota bacterium]MCI0785574.1 SDR family oxidoreductase [Chloroflexota bacterium]MCI0793392.1 SDR family oxidoreductase [Chloroflexota bacterium]